MANFLQVSEPEAAALDTQQQALAQTTNYKRMATNALVSQYGPEAADPELQQQAITADSMQQEQPSAVAADIAKNTDVPQQLQREAQLRAAYALKSALDNGVEGGTAWDTIVGPNAASWGLDPAHAAAMRQHLSQDPKEVSSASVNALIAGLTGPPKEATESLYTQPDGSTSQGWVDTTGQFHPANLPTGVQPKAPWQLNAISGALKPVYDPKTDSWSQQGTTKSGQFVKVPYEGTPSQGMNAFSSAVKAGVAVDNSEFGVDTGTVGGITGKPSLAGGGGASGGASGGVPTSYTGNVGPGQIGQKFWQQFSHPGEDINNPADNIAVARRGIDSYMSAYKDPARAAVAYYSGADNVAPPGSATPYKVNKPSRAGGTGPTTAQYAADIVAKVKSGQSVDDAILHQESGNAAFGGGGQQQAPGAQGSLFSRLPPKGQQMALSQASTIVNSSQQLQSIDQQIDNIGNMAGPFSVGLAAATRSVPGTPAHNMEAALHTLSAQGLTSWIGSMKNAAGQTGMGRILQSEAAAAMASFGSLDQGQTEDQFRYHLGIFKQRVHQLQTTAEAAFSRQYGRDPYSVLGQPAPNAPAQGGGGTFNFVNGKLVPG